MDPHEWAGAFIKEASESFFAFFFAVFFLLKRWDLKNIENTREKYRRNTSRSRHRQ
jgi:hypothetical protein